MKLKDLTDPYTYIIEREMRDRAVGWQEEIFNWRKKVMLDWSGVYQEEKDDHDNLTYGMNGIGRSASLFAVDELHGIHSLHNDLTYMKSLHSIARDEGGSKKEIACTFDEAMKFNEGD